MEAKTWIPGEISLDKPNPARIYDYWLGGHHNFEVDRMMGDKVAQVYPDIWVAAQANRAFLRRAVHFFVAQGVDQFLDIGSGLPTVGNVHEVAQAANPAARVVYVDVDPVAVAHSKAMLKDNPNAIAIQADVRQPDRILDHAEVNRLLDFGRPVAVLVLSVFPAVPDDEETYSIMRTLRDALATGSYIAITHATLEGTPREALEQIQKLYGRSVTPNKMRSRAEFLPCFDGLELVEPGVVYSPLWRPEGPDDVLLDCPERCTAFAGVARKPLAD